MSTPILVRKKQQRNIIPGAWITRLMLAACLAFASEVLLWTDATRPLWLWALLIPGYVAVSALILDALERFRVYEIFGVLVTGAVYGLVASLFLNPAVTFETLPISFVTRVMGGQVVAGLMGMMLLITLFGGVRNSRHAMLVSLIVGLLWGIWVHGYPVVTGREAIPPAGLAVMLIAGAVAIAVILLLQFLLRQINEPVSLLLSVPEWGIVILIGGFLFIAGITRGDITRNAISYAVVMLSYCGVFLWFQRRDKPGYVLSSYLPPAAPSLNLLMMMGAVFLVSGALGYMIYPLPGDTVNLASIMAVLFGGVGLTLLPAVSLVIGVRAYRQQLRTGKML